MSTLALEGHPNFTSPSKQGACIGRYVSHLQIRPHMQAIKFIGFPVAKSAILIHEHASGRIFLSRLEEKEEIVFGLGLDQFV